MALWMHREQDTLTVHYVSVLLWAQGLSVAAAMLVLVLFELSQKPRSRGPWRETLQKMTLVLPGTAVVRTLDDAANRSGRWNCRAQTAL